MQKYEIIIENPNEEEFYLIKKEIQEKYQSEILPKDYSNSIKEYRFIIIDSSLENMEEILTEFSGTWSFNKICNK